MKLYHFASAAASVLVLGIAAPAFAQSGYIVGMYGENRDHPRIKNTEEVNIIGAFAVPVGMLEFSGEASYLDTGRDPLVIDQTLSRAQDTSFDVQTLYAGSVYVRNDKFAYGATVAGGELGDIIFDQFDGSIANSTPSVCRTSPPSNCVPGTTPTGLFTQVYSFGIPTTRPDIGHSGSPKNLKQGVFTKDSITEIEGSVFAQMYADKWVGSVRFAVGNIHAGTIEVANPACVGSTATECGSPGPVLAQPVQTPGGDPPLPVLYGTGTARFIDLENHLNYSDVTLDGNFFFTDNAQLTLGVDWKDIEFFDPVVSSSIGLEWQPKGSPISLKSNIEFSKWGNSIMLGLVGTFGAGSVSDRVRKGPANPYISTLRQYSNEFITGGF